MVSISRFIFFTHYGLIFVGDFFHAPVHEDPILPSPFVEEATFLDHLSKIS